MARPLKPLIRGGGYYPSRRLTPLVYPGGYTTADGGGEPAPIDPKITLSGSLVRFNCSEARPFINTSVEIVPQQSGSGDPSPSNVRPISGWTEVNVTRTGKNLLNDVNPTVLNAYFVNGSTVSSENLYQRMVVIPCVPSTAYTFTWNRVAISGTQNARVVAFTSEPTYGSSGSLLAASVAENGSASFTTGANDHYIVIHMGDIRTTDIQASISASMLELNSTATDYEAYNGNTYTIQLGDTVYGGTLTINEDGSGELVASMALVDMGTLPWQIRESLGGFSTTVTPTPKNQFNAISSYYPYKGVYSSVTDKAFGYVYNNHVFIKDSAYSDAASLKTALNGQTLCYELATPIVTTLTAQQINTLVGENNVWADSGDIEVTVYGTEVE